MNISNIKNYKNTLAAFMFGAAVAVPGVKAFSQNTMPVQQDEFVKAQQHTVSPSGTNNVLILRNAPDPHVVIAGTEKIAAIVVDVDKNLLYRYNSDGEAEYVYLIATGKPSKPTHKGVRVVSHIESYPYKTAPVTTVRRNSPKSFGPKAIILNKLDPVTGKTSSYDEFIHGNNDASSIGKKASKGCMRMDNDVILEMAKIIKKGDIVVII